MTRFASIFPPSLGHRSDIPPGSFILVEDVLQADGTFLLHHLIDLHLGNPHRTSIGKESDIINQVCLITSSGQVEHHRAVLKKLGYNLNLLQTQCELFLVNYDPHITTWADCSSSTSITGRLVQAAGSESPDASETGTRKTGAGQNVAEGQEIWVASSVPPLVDGEDFLQALFVRVEEKILKQEKVKGEDRNICIVVDNANLLEVVAGGSSTSVLDFVDYCSTLRGGSKRCSILALAHADVEDETGNKLLTALNHRADMSLQVRGLSTGHAADIHGQVTLVPRSSKLECRQDCMAPQIPCTQVQLRYKLQDKGVTFLSPHIL